LARIAGASGAVVQADLGRVSVGCSERRIVVETRAGKEPIVGPRADVAALLPEEMAGASTQVVAVGDVLLSATPGSNGLVVTRHRCAPPEP
jgi:hypothetical protein